MINLTSLVEKMQALLHIRENHVVDRRIKQIEDQSSEVKEHLDNIAASNDPFADLVRTMRQAAIQRRRNQNGPPDPV